ncbi:MAG: hypothetical protein WAT19_15355 [Ferruginibacter sp.]
MKKIFFAVSISLFSTVICHAQTDCKVSPDDLKGTYSGDCSGGKANGKGVAVGTDRYEGDFVNGYPEGTGTYKWQDSSFYTGSWKKGRREGKGEMHYKRKYQADSVLTGYWKKDKYNGEYEVQYKINGYSSRVNRVSCSVVKLRGNDIQIKTTQLTNTAGGLAGAVVLPSLNNVVTLSGNFVTKNEQKLTNSQIITLKNVDFPYKAIFYYSNGEQVEIIFYEHAEYSVDVVLL